VNSSLVGLDMLSGEQLGGCKAVSTPSSTSLAGGSSSHNSVIELKTVPSHLPPTPSSLSPPDVSSVTLLPHEGSQQGPQGATISWNLPDLLVGLESSMRGPASQDSPPPHPTQFNLTSTIPSSCTSSISQMTSSDSGRSGQYVLDSFRHQPDSLLEGLGILTPPPVSMARVKTELVTSSTDTSPLGSITNLAIPQYNLDPVTGVQAGLSDLTPLVPNFELNLAAPKSEPGSSTAFSVSIANIDILTGRTEPAVPLSLDLIAQHCTLLPPELVGQGEQILVPSLGSPGARGTCLSSFVTTDQMADQTMAELSPIIQDPIKEEEECLDPRVMDLDQPGPNQGSYKRCHLCVRIFSTKANLSSHIRHVHLGEAKHSRIKSIPCPHCNKMFSRKGHMTEHVRTVHEGKKRIYKEVNCQHCGKTFRRKWGLNIHISSAHADVVSSLVK